MLASKKFTLIGLVAMGLCSAAEAGLLSRCANLLIRRNEAVAQAKPTPTIRNIDFKTYSLDGEGPIGFESLRREIESLQFEIQSKEFELQNSQVISEQSQNFGNPMDFQRAQTESQNSQFDLIQKKQRLEKLYQLRDLTTQESLTKIIDNPVEISHRSQSDSLSLKTIDMNFHRDPLANIQLGAHGGSGLYGRAGHEAAREKSPVYNVTVKKGTRLADSTNDDFQRIKSLVIQIDGYKIDQLHNQYLQTRLDAGLPGGLSRETYRQMYGYDVAADFSGAELVWASNFNSTGGGEYILRSKSAVESFKKALDAPE